MFAVKRRLKLNQSEKTLMEKHAGFSRFVYNYGLDLFWQSVDVGLKTSDSRRLAAIKKCLTQVTKKLDEYSWMNELSSTVYQSAFQDLQAAFSRWRQNLSEIPVFKTKKDSRSFTVYNCNGLSLVQSGRFIKIPTLGRFRLLEPLDESYVSQTFTLSHQAGEWYVSFCVNAEKIPPILHSITEPIGIDLGVKTFATISDGTQIEAPKPLKNAKTKLRRLQYRNRNKQLGNRQTGEKASNNAKKYYKKLAKLHKKIADQRQDFLNKTTTYICKTYAHIKIEDLNVAGMIANRKLSAAISDLGFYEFRRQLEYKASMNGSKLDIVDRWFPSSKTCRMCGTKHESLKLKDRVFVCQSCGHTEDRDLQAAKNLAIALEEICSRGRIAPKLEACGQEGADSLGRSRKF